MIVRLFASSLMQQPREHANVPYFHLVIFFHLQTYVMYTLAMRFLILFPTVLFPQLAPNFSLSTNVFLHINKKENYLHHYDKAILRIQIIFNRESTF